MPDKLFNNVQHWRDRAEESRKHAELISDPVAKRLMLEIVEGYEHLAQRAEQRLRDPTKPK
jgi:O-methyltransferase involved in polyketide biosynthesis